jgi:hypothetical protein
MRDRDNRTALDIATENGSDRLLQILRQVEPSRADGPDSGIPGEGVTGILGEELIQAAIRGDVEGVRKLLGKGADVHHMDSDGFRAIDRARDNGHDAVVEMLAKAVKPAPVPVIDGDFWQIAGNPDLGDLGSEQQQPVDFGIWQAGDGTWQLWSCIRKTNCGGNTRLFHGWEGESLEQVDWSPVGITMRADTTLGEQPGGLQAPHVILDEGIFYMLYGDWSRICLAKSKDGKEFHRILKPSDGEPDLFT